MKSKLVTLIAICVLTVSSACTAEEPVIPPDEFVYCTVCHGVQLMGNAVLQAPRISGMDATYAERQLQLFKSGQRGKHELDVIGREMQPMAAALSEAQIPEAAKFVAATRSDSPVPSIEGDVAAGKTSFESCAACHGDGAEGNAELHAPALTGLNDWYVVSQLQQFLAGARGSDPDDIIGQQMGAAAQLLGGDDEIANVAAYIATLDH
jgi:cytochrome c oxidase subunit 2